VDHVIPVCQDGTNDPENLVTSCVDCNLGKAGKTITQSAPTEQDRLRMAQEMQEQVHAAKMARAASDARKERRQSLVNYWCEQTMQDTADSATISTVFTYVEEYGEAVVYRWIDKAAEKCGDDKRMGKYISGIRRLTKAEEGEE
jgi:hypothetical protein